MVGTQFWEKDERIHLDEESGRDDALYNGSNREDWGNGGDRSKGYGFFVPGIATVASCVWNSQRESQLT